MYKSPVTVLETFMDSVMEEHDDKIVAILRSKIDVDVDKDELIRALQYDRNQYEAGYWDGQADAKAELLRCKDCKHLMFSDCYGECRQGHLGIVKPDDFCSYGERKDND